MPVRLVALVVCVLLAGAAAAIALTRGGGGDDLQGASRAGTIVWAVGDGADGSDRARRVARLIARDRPRRVLYLGDVYETGSAADFRERFATVYGSLARRIDPTPGNHDWPRHAVGYDPYWRKVKGRRVPASLRVQRRRLAAHQRQQRDARQPPPARVPAPRAHARRTAPARSCSCTARASTRASTATRSVHVDPIWQVLRGKAAILLGGHDHDLQRFRPVGGTVQYVIGAGGRARYRVDGGDRRLAFSDDSVDGALRMRLNPRVARLSIVAANGDVLDRSTVRCQTR